MRDVYIVDGRRTPFVKFKGKPNPYTAVDLALACIQPMLQEQSFPIDDIAEVIVGCVAPAATEANIARIIALRLGLPIDTVAWTVQRNCASGLQALDCAAKDVASGRYECVLAGGTEAMSRAPLNFDMRFVNWLSDVKSAKTPASKIKKFFKFRPNFLLPEISLLKGLTDPVVAMSMGATAEELAYRFEIDRYCMDEFAMKSHKRAAAAQQDNKLNEVSPLYDWAGNVVVADNGVRADSSIDKLAQLKPVFDKKYGLVTAGNSSQITDGAAFLLLANGKFVTKYNLTPLAEIKACVWQALDPKVMGLGPAHSIATLLKENNLSLQDIDFWEINEAFAAQVIACCKALADEKYCQEHFNQAPFGEISSTQLNVNGGAIALGHPVGASGARIVLHLINTLHERKKHDGIASLCIGGGQGGAMWLTNVGDNI